MLSDMVLDHHMLEMRRKRSCSPNESI